MEHLESIAHAALQPLRGLLFVTSARSRVFLPIIRPIKFLWAKALSVDFGTATSEKTLNRCLIGFDCFRITCFWPNVRECEVSVDSSQ